jgi:homoserine kinase
MNEIKYFALLPLLIYPVGLMCSVLLRQWDEMIAENPKKGFASLKGADLPLETERNVAGVAGLALLDAVETDFGFDIEIYKNIKAGSGIGSSASAAGAVYGINALPNPFETKDLVQFAMQGEKLVATPMLTMLPCPFGGFTLVRSYSPLDIINRKSFRIIRHGRSSTD